jgi:hypothetical protein
MQLASRAGAGRLAALSRHFINIALDQRGAPEDHFERIFQVFKTLAQSEAQAAEVLQSAFILHVIILYHKQIIQSKTEKSKASVKMFIYARWKPATARGWQVLFLLSELQLSLTGWSLIFLSEGIGSPSFRRLSR